MRRLHVISGAGLLACGLMAAMFPAAAAPSGPSCDSLDLRQSMTVAAFDEAGLDQLGGGQLAGLNRWLQDNGAGLCPAPANGNTSIVSAICPQAIDLRDFMTVSSFDQAGLDRLDSDQLAVLNGWLRNNIRGLCGTAGAVPGAGAPAAAASGEAAFGAPPPPAPKAPSRIESRITGDFHGWTGNTTFYLENGQVWKQAGPGYFEVNLHNPKVVIKKLLIGYVLLVDGYAKEVFVRRVR